MAKPENDLRQYSSETRLPAVALLIELAVNDEEIKRQAIASRRKEKLIRGKALMNNISAYCRVDNHRKCTSMNCQCSCNHIVEEETDASELSS